LVRVTVDVPERGYDVVIGRGVLGEAAAHLPPFPRAEKAFVVSDQTVAGLYFDRLSSGLSAGGLQPIHLGVPEGEEAKALQTATVVYHQLATQEAHRDDVIMALGGGAAGDLAGFVAATYMRGVPFVQVPTTLTAQVDAAIGGKTAVNLPEGKNLVGAFHQPRAVLADVTTLATLSEREFCSGLAEVAKYALTLDTDLLELLERDPKDMLAREPAVLEDLIARCVRAKAGIVAKDERDAGARVILNYGHTLGHALERLDSFRGRSHGEAISIGMMFAARLAESMAIAAPGLPSRHARLFKSLGLEPGGGLPPADQVIAAMRLDKKYAAGVRFVLLTDVGRPEVVEGITEDLIRTTLKEMGSEG
jgi:3-dehydroquinate synthase